MNFEELSVKIDAPYPTPLIPYNNPLEAKKLMNDYSGRDGETTAILQYCYQAYVLKKEYPLYSQKLKEIAMVEMKHHMLLGVTISGLGGFPVIGGKNTFWNGGNINYVGNLKKMIEVDIQSEEVAIYNYKNTLLQIQNADIKSLIDRIILDEQQHIVVFKAMLLNL